MLTLAACFFLGACGNNADEADDRSAEQNAAITVDDQSAEATFEDVLGVWGTLEVCTGEPLVIDRQTVAVASEACTITTVNGSEGSFELNLLCPAEGGARYETWLIAADLTSPINAIAITRDGAVAELIRCPAN